MAGSSSYATAQLRSKADCVEAGCKARGCDINSALAFQTPRVVKINDWILGTHQPAARLLPFCWHPPRPVAGVSIDMRRGEAQQNDRTLADGAGATHKALMLAVVIYIIVGAVFIGEVHRPTVQTGLHHLFDRCIATCIARPRPPPIVSRAPHSPCSNYRLQSMAMALIVSRAGSALLTPCCRWQRAQGYMKKEAPTGNVRAGIR